MVAVIEGRMRCDEKESGAKSLKTKSYTKGVIDRNGVSLHFIDKNQYTEENGAQMYQNLSNTTKRKDRDRSKCGWTAESGRAYRLVGKLE